MTRWGEGVGLGCVSACAEGEAPMASGSLPRRRDWASASGCLVSQPPRRSPNSTEGLVGGRCCSACVCCQHASGGGGGDGGGGLTAGRCLAPRLSSQVRSEHKPLVHKSPEGQQHAALDAFNTVAELRQGSKRKI